MSTCNSKLFSKKLNTGIEMFGDSWMLFIIGALANKQMRFCEIERSLNGINPTTLTDRLKKLEHEKMIVRKKETIDKLSVVYSLTQKGKGIVPVIKEIQKYAETFL